MPFLRLNIRPICFLTVLLLLGGCDLFTDEDTVIRASGTVVLASTSEPISGLSVALDSDAGGPGGHRRVVTTRTDAAGHFSLRYDTDGKNFVFTVYVNDNPFDSRYTGRREIVQPGETRDLGIIELEVTED